MNYQKIKQSRNFQPLQDVSIEHLRELQQQLKENYKDLNITINPDKSQIKTGCYVGVIKHSAVTIEIIPKFEVPLLYMLLYTKRKRSLEFLFDKEDYQNKWNISVLINLFRKELESLISKGLVKQGYVSNDDTSRTFQGKLRCTDQIRKHFNRVDMLEITVDDHTEDILENRVLKTAIELILRHLYHFGQLDDLNRLKYLNQYIEATVLDDFSNNATEITYDNLNYHYKEVIELARILLSSTSAKMGGIGQIKSWEFLLNCETVFESFIREKLKEKMKNPYNIKKFKKSDPEKYYLDPTNSIYQVLPDIVVADEDTNKFICVADAKYKLLKQQANHADVYQMVSYMQALEVTRGVLIYVTAISMSDLPKLVKIGKKGLDLYSVALNWKVSIEEFERQIEEIANLLVTSNKTTFLNDQQLSLT